MRFVVDENVSLSVARELEAAGHAGVSVAKESASLKDEDVYAMAVAQKAILIPRPPLCQPDSVPIRQDWRHHLHPARQTQVGRRGEPCTELRA
ncbi:MAG: DUF5615 family PIN-like protein [Clostridia bacterium]|nr:DUF5615 family PIN-like protein [Clostridia bacterium]